MTSKDYRRGYAAGNASRNYGIKHQISNKDIDDILVKVWNDIVNRQAGKIIFKDAVNILEARNLIINLTKSEQL